MKEKNHRPDRSGRAPSRRVPQWIILPHENVVRWPTLVWLMAVTSPVYPYVGSGGLALQPQPARSALLCRCSLTFCGCSSHARVTTTTWLVRYTCKCVFRRFLILSRLIGNITDIYRCGVKHRPGHLALYFLFIALAAYVLWYYFVVFHVLSLM